MRVKKDYGIEFCVLFSILLFPMIIYMTCEIFNEVININIEHHYIDLDGNQGIADWCDRNMTCHVNDKLIQVKEYWQIN